MSRLPHFLDSRLTDGGEVSFKRQPQHPHRKIPGTHCCLRLSNPQAYTAAGRIWLTNKIQLHHWEWNSMPVYIIIRAHIKTFLRN
jgi:hypothetical protein